MEEQFEDLILRAKKEVEQYESVSRETYGRMTQSCLMLVAKGNLAQFSALYQSIADAILSLRCTYGDEAKNVLMHIKACHNAIKKP